MKYIIQVWKERSTDMERRKVFQHGKKEGLTTEYQCELEQEMLKHVHDLKKELREKGWWKEINQRFLRPHFLEVKTQMQNWDWFE